jgi:hypothetical protein
MGKSKRSEKTSLTVTKKTRVLPPMHESQEKLAKRASEVGTDEALIFVAPPGYGKTRVVGRYIKLAQEGGVSLTFYVGATAYMCNKQSFEIGSNFDYSYQYAKQHRQITQMLMSNMSVVSTMTPAMFNKLCFGDAETRELDPLRYFKTTILAMVQSTPCTTVRFVLDEMHTFFNRRYASAIKAMRQAAKPTTVVITGLTATPPQFEAESEASDLASENRAVLKAMTRCVTPTTIEYTPEEMTAFDADLRPQPDVGQFNVVKLPCPSRESKFAQNMTSMATLIVGSMLVGETTIRTRTCLEHASSIVLAKQAHDGGGKAFAHIKQEPMRRAMNDGKLGKTSAPHHEALAIAHSTLCGASTAFVSLSTLQGQEDVAPFSLHDLRSSEITSLDASIASFKQAFSDQVKPALAIINPAMRHSTNAFAKNTSGILAIGHWTSGGLKQLAGRLSRPCALEKDDIVADKFKLIHLDSDWQRQVLAIRATRVSPRNVKLSDGDTAMLDQVLSSDFEPKEKATVESNVYKLAIADERCVLGKTSMCSRYLEALLDDAKAQELRTAHEEEIAGLATYKDAEEGLKLSYDEGA